MSRSPLTPDALKSSLPAGGLFADKEWVLSPEPFRLSKAEVKELTGMGHRLRVFYEACDRIYIRSKKGTLPPYISDYLDAGKPPWLVGHATAKGVRGQLPRVIRPDLLPQEGGGFAVSELDSVPGGIGLTAWLQETYADAGFPVLGGRRGMKEGFASIHPDGADIVVSDESADYRPEMAWLAEDLPGDWAVERAEDYPVRPGREVYRFFELFDHASVPAVRDLAAAVEAGLGVSPPLRPHLEEKLWAALFWLAPLRGVWEQELRGSHLKALRKMVPYSWVVDPTPLPHHAVLPRLEVQSWDDVAQFSQKQRELVLKISGFSELGWGSRGVTIGHDVSGEAWGQALERALGGFPETPYLLQEFRPARIVEHPFWDPETGEQKRMEARARLCPYYFTDPRTGKTVLGGVLATLVPSDKKLVHGMRDAVLVPCAPEEE
jgi:hypothetical protein